jgi:hypothetical protein
MNVKSIHSYGPKIFRTTVVTYTIYKNVPVRRKLWVEAHYQNGKLDWERIALKNTRAWYGTCATSPDDDGIFWLDVRVSPESLEKLVGVSEVQQ